MASKYILYIISENKETETQGWFKLGVTNDADRRLREHQTSNPRELTYRKLYTFPNSLMAEIIERSLLQKLPYKDYVLDHRAEWFLVEDVKKLELNVDQAVEELKKLIKQFTNFVEKNL